MKKFILGAIVLLLAGAASAQTLYPAQCATCQGPYKRSLNGVTTGTGTVYQLNYAVPVITFEFYCTGTSVASGTVVVEYAPAGNQAGSWTTLYTWTAALAPTTITFSGERYGAVRARFTADLTGVGTPLAYVALIGSGY